MLSEYIAKALGKATYKCLEDGTWYGEIPGFAGVWANGPQIESCRRELIDVLEEWIFLKVRDGDPVPQVDGTTLHVQKVA